MKKSKKKKYFIFGGILVVIGLFIVLPRLIGNPAAAHTMAQQPAQLITLEKTDLTRTFSASGVVQSADTQYVYSPHNRPVKEILVEVGDRVQAGDILARLDMSSVETDIAQTELNLISAQRNVEEEIRTNANSVINAQTSLESARISLQRQDISIANAEKDLEEALSDMFEPFDSYIHDRNISDALVQLERRIEDFEKAQSDLLEALNDFDDYTYVNAITEARINLERRLVDLETAEADLDEETRKRADALDETNLKNTISDAERNLDRRRDDENAASNNFSNAWNIYLASPPETSATAWQSLSSAQTALDNARRAVEDAELALERARDELTRARRNHNDNTSDQRDNAISAAERTFNNAQNAADDAQRSLDRAISDLDRAKSNAETNAGERLKSAINSMNDAQRSYERAVSDRERAAEDYITTNETRLNNAQRMMDESQNQYQSAQNSLRSAQETLNQATNRPAASGTNVEIQSINLERLNTQLEEGVIFATASGVITEINATVGATASGVLFMIEDVDNLYVSANVREHSLSELQVGQQAFVATEITRDKTYDASLTFISPRAVSSFGSTSVEFEIRAAMNENDGAIRIGMNAFINVITAYAEDVFAVPLSALVTNENGSFIYAMVNDEQQEIPVTVGLKTSTHAEISGNQVSSGMSVLSRAPGTLGESSGGMGPAMMIGW